MARKVNPTPKVGFANATLDGLARDVYMEMRDHATRLNLAMPLDGSEPMTGPEQSVVYTVSTLPTPGVVGRRAFVSDSSVTTFNTAYASGGTNKVPIFDDGTLWRVG